MFAGTSTFADGCFVFRWNKQKDINEPTQKAILFHDQNREDLILQVKYEGPAEDFGWLIPVPGQPEVRKAYSHTIPLPLTLICPEEPAPVLRDMQKMTGISSSPAADQFGRGD